MAQSQLKVAILLCGHIRTFEQCKDDFVKIFGNYDVFLDTYDKKYGYHPYIKSVLKYEEDEEMDSKQIEDAFDGVNLKRWSVENQTEVDAEVKEISNGFDKKMQPFLEGYCQYRKAARCIDLMKEYEEANGFVYDICIKMRMDIICRPIILESVPVNTVIVDQNNVFPSDCITIGSRDVIVKLPLLVMQEYTTPLPESEMAPPHGVFYNVVNFHLKCVFSKQNIITKLIRELKRSSALVPPAKHREAARSSAREAAPAKHREAAPRAAV
jgi:hypothetical protein